jgi:hypothetical protein
MLCGSYTIFPNSEPSSPNGQQFVSCKEVSSYLLSIFGLQDASKPRSGHSEENFQLASKMDLGDVSQCLDLCLPI